MIDQIILSCNEDPTYMEFWKPVSWAYSKMFPDVKIHLAFLTNRDENDPLVKEFRQYGKVTLFKPLPDIPEFGQAKMIRFILASEQGEDVCMIDDVDLYPLSKKFITDKIERRPKNVLLCVGAEVYGFSGTCPVSNMCAEGNVWQEFINPYELEYKELINSWTGYFYTDKEKINIDLDFSKDRFFSDEALIRRLLRENPVPVLNIARGYDNYLLSTIDRHTFDKENERWVFDREALKRGEYMNAHCIRPFKRYEYLFEPLINYIKENYPD